MAILKFNNVGIAAVAACVPPRVVSNYDYCNLLPDRELEKVIHSVGIGERRVVDEGVCASDLCYLAAKRLMEDNDIDPDTIDVLLFTSQCADYRIPATAPILQHRLGLPTSVMAMDLSLGCSGYVYSLSTAYAYASLPGIRRVLLLDGEALSTYCNPKDKVNVLLYGDAGTATLIEKGDYGESVFILNTDGSGHDAVKIFDGGMRNGFSESSLKVEEREDGNYRSNLQLYMDGMDVFNFAIRVVPRGVKEIMTCAGCTLEQVDYLIYHQSNKYMTDFFTKRLKVPSEKVPYSLSKYGNASSASIPLTIASELQSCLSGRKKLVLCGFGAGLSWGTAVLNVINCQVSDIVTYTEE